MAHNAQLTEPARRAQRRELIRQYMHLQRSVVDGDVTSPAFQGTLQAFRHMGYTLISSGFEEDLDRLLRFHLVEGGRDVPSARDERTVPSELYELERR